MTATALRPLGLDRHPVDLLWPPGGPLHRPLGPQPLLARRARGKVFSPGNEPYSQWFRPLAFWRRLGFDKESLIADPQFVGARRHDYRLEPTSAALKLGFEPIDLSTVGPRQRAAR